MLSAFAVIPSPPTTFIVLVAAIVPPPVKPLPAVTLTEVWSIFSFESYPVVDDNVICEEPLTTPSPVVLNTVPSTVMLSAFAVIPSPPITLIVKAPVEPPPVKPVPAVTDSISPASFVNEITPVPLL